MAPPLRVLHVLPWLNSGGVERRRAELVKRLPSGEFEQRIACMEGGSLLEDLRQRGVRVDAIGGTWLPTDVRSLKRLVGICRGYRPDIVHGAVFEGVTMASLAGALTSVPVRLIEEIANPTTRSWRGRALFRVFAATSSGCIAVSEVVRRRLIEQGVHQSKIHLLTNGISPAPFNPVRVEQLRRELALQPGERVVASVGRLYDHLKRFSDLIAAVREVRGRARIRLLIVGEGPDRGLLERQALDAGIEQSVNFLGYRDDIGNVLAVSDALALVSTRESFGLAIVEGMHAGLPVIATRCGGPEEIVVDNETGFLVDVAAPRQIAERLLRLQDAELAHRLGEQGRRRAELLFGAERYVAQVADLYRTLSSRQ